MMESLDVVLRMRSVEKMDRERLHRLNLCGYHNLRIGRVCHCVECERLRGEASEIQARINEVEG